MTTGVRADWAEFAPRLSAHWLATEPDRLHRRLRGALVSADLSGFTAMSERLASAGREGSERLTAIVNSCFEALISVAHRGGGDVLKFGGDALLLYFEGEEGAERAARASAQMQRVMPRPGSGTRSAPRMPTLGETLMRTLLFAAGDEDKRAADAADLVVTTQTRNIGLLEFHQIDEAISAGRAAGRAVVESLTERGF